MGARGAPRPPEWHETTSLPRPAPHAAPVAQERPNRGVMPGNVPLADAVEVLPQALCKEFAAARDYPVLVNEYPCGESQREIMATNSRRSWKQKRRLTAALMTALRTFYDARGADPFFFYDPMEPAEGHAIGSNWDGTGASLQGRFTVRFQGAFSQDMGLGLGEVGLELVELAQHMPDAELLTFDKENSSGQVFSAGF